MNVERLKHLITVLEGVSEDKKPFDLNAWIEKKSKDAGYHACQTTACAFGYAALDPVFQKQGLILQTRKGRKIRNVEEFNKMQRRFRDDVTVMFKEKESWEAAREFFGLYFSNATYLFSPESYPEGSNATPQQVIERVKELIESAF